VTKSTLCFPTHWPHQPHPLIRPHRSHHPHWLLWPHQPHQPLQPNRPHQPSGFQGCPFPLSQWLPASQQLHLSQELPSKFIPCHHIQGCPSEHHFGRVTRQSFMLHPLQKACSKGGAAFICQHTGPHKYPHLRPRSGPPRFARRCPFQLFPLLV
jgi:hypothetical protein